MKRFKLFVLSVLLTLASVGTAFAQVAPIRGQVSAGVYENLVSDGSGHLIVNTNTSTTAPPPPQTGACATTSVIVTNSSQALVAANTSRKALIIQNNHATAIVYLAFGATAATTSLITLIGGASISFLNIIPTQAVNLIGSIASNATVAVLECS